MIWVSLRLELSRSKLDSDGEHRLVVDIESELATEWCRHLKAVTEEINSSKNLKHSVY